MQAPDEREGGGLIGYFVRHRTAANLLVLLTVVLGLVGATEMRRQLLPEVEPPSLSVQLRWPGAGAEQMDRAVLALVEPALRDLDGLESSFGEARDNRVWLTLTFDPDADLDRATADARAALDGVTGLPDGVEPPEVVRNVWREPVAEFVIHGPASPDRLILYADELARRFGAAGLSAVDVRGRDERVIEVRAPEAALIRHGLTLRGLADAVEAAADADPAGFAEGASVRLSAGTERRSVEALTELPLRRGADGGPDLRLGDVAEVAVTPESRSRRYYVAGDPAVILRLERNEGEDALDLLGAARAVVADYAPTLPAGVAVTESRVRADMVENRLALLLDNAALGLLMVLVLLFLFLSSRAAFWVAAGIPTALLAAIGAMWLTGFTLNLVSLFALIIMLGMVVDDAIVVGEHADALARRGLPPALAAERAARRMAGPVFAASITTAIAFASALVIGGPFGDMIEDIPYTVVLVLAASLLECFLILPAHMAHAAKPGRGRLLHWLDAPSRVVDRGFSAFREWAFRPAMRWAVALRHPLLGLAVLLLLGAIEQLATGALPWRFWHGPERNEFRVMVAMLDSAEREDTFEQVAAIEAAVREVAAEYAAETGTDPTLSIVSAVGYAMGGRRNLSAAESKPQELLGGVQVELRRRGEDRPMPVSEIVRRVSDRTPRHPLSEVVAFRAERGGPAGDALSARFFGPDPAALKAAAEALKAATAEFPEIVGVEDTLSYGRDELTLALSPLGRALGFTSESLAAELAGRFDPIRAVRTVEAGRELEILVALPREEKTADYRRRALIPLPDGGHAPLSVLTEAARRPGFDGYRRIDGRLVVQVQGDVVTEDAERAAEIDAALRGRIVPRIAALHGVDWDLAGLAEQERRFLADAQVGAAIGIVGIYAALAWVFGSWTRPFAVLLVVPFGFVGVVWGHVWMDVPLSMFSIVGLLGMTGIIVNDSIVLVTAVDEAARRRALIPAVVDAVCGRLRPVLLTTLTTVFGLAPLLFETSQEAASLKPTVVTLVFGLGFGFFLVLMVTPALVLLQRDLGAALTSMRRMTRLATRRRRGLGAP